MAQTEKKMWFAPKNPGYGSSLPISWEGWAVLALFFAGTAAARWLAFTYFTGGVRMAVTLSIVAALILVLALIARARTEGGWRWR
jgi:hypothetical protein